MKKASEKVISKMSVQSTEKLERIWQYIANEMAIFWAALKNGERKMNKAINIEMEN